MEEVCERSEAHRFVLQPLRNKVPAIFPGSWEICVLWVLHCVGEHVLTASPEDDLHRERRVFSKGEVIL